MWCFVFRVLSILVPNVLTDYIFFTGQVTHPHVDLMNQNVVASPVVQALLMLKRNDSVWTLLWMTTG